MTDASRDWPTPLATTKSGANGHYRGDDPKAGRMLEHESRQWKTPHGFQAGNGPDGNEFSKSVRNWATPRAEDSESSGMRHERGVADTLTAQTNLWATPVASCGTKGAEDPATKAARQKLTGGGTSDLLIQAQNWPTPAARDQKGENSEEHLSNGTGRLHLDQLPNYVAFRFLPRVLPTSAGPDSSPSTATLRQRLNPAFVCWLMGWPWWWTRAEPTSFGAEGTALWRSTLQLHLSYLLAGR